MAALAAAVGVGVDVAAGVGVAVDVAVEYSHFPSFVATVVAAFVVV